MKYVRGVMFLNGQTIPVRQPITAEDFTQQFMFMKIIVKIIKMPRCYYQKITASYGYKKRGKGPRETKEKERKKR